jgi:tetratricopeptide (TPR) repeat protein
MPQRRESIYAVVTSAATATAVKNGSTRALAFRLGMPMSMLGIHGAKSDSLKSDSLQAATPAKSWPLGIITVSDNRQPKPQHPHAMTVSLQQPYQQVTVSYQPFAAAGTTTASESAETHYSRANALKEQKCFPAALSIFDKAIALKPDYAEAHNGRGIVLFNLDRTAEAIAGFDRAIALKPDYAEAYNNRGLVLQDLKRFDDALASFEKALALQPDNARLHNNRGTALHDAGRLDEALASYDHAIVLKSDYAEAYYNRGVAMQDLQRLDEALAAFDAAIALKPDYAAAHNNRGVVLQDFKRLGEAAAAFEKTIALSGSLTDAHVNLGYCLLLMGRFSEGWPLHERRKKAAAFWQPLWLGEEDVAGKTVFVHFEQGLGDTIQFCRYAKLLAQRGAKVVMSVQNPLHSLLEQMSPDIAIVRNDRLPAAFDYHCPLLSLPLAFGTTLKTIPSEAYIFADEQRSKAWEARLPPRTKPRIGLVWAGNAQQKNDRNRSAGLPALAPLLSADAQWISLQKELRAGDADLLGSLPQIARYGEKLGDFSDTAALLDRLDLIVTVDTSVAHLAGAMGKPVWILLAFNADWRYLADRDDCPWYPSARLFRQDKLGAWDNVVARLGAALREYISSHSRQYV